MNPIAIILLILVLLMLFGGASLFVPFVYGGTALGLLVIVLLVVWMAGYFPPLPPPR